MAKPEMKCARRALMDRKNSGEIVDPVPLEIIPPKTAGLRLSADDRIKMSIRKFLAKDEHDVESFDEADDFEVDDEGPPMMSQYEVTDMQADAEFGAAQEIQIDDQKEEEKSAPKDAPEQGADEKSSS